ncbi:SdpI family protein [Frigoribacterium sp. VKM Ac-2530]|uniref:SdpI family protein n=1 Tax=Frigoribacterium sp. VKM Ac-2530 TaxID=2783822 RepID=UPI00351C19D7
MWGVDASAAASCRVCDGRGRNPTDLSTSGAGREHVLTVWVAVALSVLATVIASLAGRGSVAANGLVGIRTPALRSSDAAWRAGHRAAVPILAALTVVSAAAGVVVFAATWGKGADVTNMAGLWVIGLVVTAIVLAAVRANAVAASSDPETH